MTEPTQTAEPPPAAPTSRVRIGLSGKLLVLTALVVMISEVFIYVPSIANFRLNWLHERLNTAEAAALVLTASDEEVIPRPVQDQLLAAVGAHGIAIRSGEMSWLIAAVEMPPAVDRIADLRQMHPMHAIFAAFDTLWSRQELTLRVLGQTERGETLELVMGDRPLRAAMFTYSFNILALSAIISIVTAAAVYLALNYLLVRPMLRMSQSMLAFTGAPEDVNRIVTPSGRHDELGAAEERLAEMQRELQTTLQEQRHLADLGLAVAKINHDLRNMLASAQIISDRLGTVADPTVQRFAPKLIAALDRAICYCQASLGYSRPREAAPERRLVALDRLVDDVAEMLGLDGQPSISFENRVPAGIEIDADPDQLSRVLVNVGRNAIQAMESSDDDAVIRRLTVDARREGTVVTISVADTGPGVPEQAKARLFQAFQGSAKSGSTGLGLAIAAELIRAHGGDIRLVESPGPGAIFELSIPDRPIAFDRAKPQQRRESRA